MIQLSQMPLAKTKIVPEVKNKDTLQATFIVVTIVSIWLGSLTLLLSIELSNLPILALAPLILWQTFLYTGLFITAHDAMHGVAFPQNQKINSFVGSLALFLYGFLSYKKLLKKHWLHHNNPASTLDPDFHDGTHKNLFAWYFHFMKGYWSWTQIIGLVVLFNLAQYKLHIPNSNLTLFWIIPPILSSVQLFYFGTFLPHREPEGGYINSHRAYSSPRPILWSFITCYHFGYHEEHHESPHLPWWQLPMAYKMH